MLLIGDFKEPLCCFVTLYADLAACFRHKHRLTESVKAGSQTSRPGSDHAFSVSFAHINDSQRPPIASHRNLHLS